MHITVDPASDVPIYQQIVDHFHRHIRSGLLEAGQQLPTVRELSDQTGLARGTVKHAYDILVQLGLIEMVQGRGTFVHDASPNQVLGKKDQAMTAIDSLLDLMESLAFTPQEIRIFLDLKLREREQTIKNVRVGAVDCSPEALSVISGQISALPHVDIYEYLLDAILNDPTAFDPDMDLLITTASHYQQLKTLLPPDKKLIQLVLSIAPQTAVELSRIPAGARIGILCASKRFADLIAAACAKYCAPECRPEVAYLGSGNLDGFLAGHDWLILPPNHLHFCSVHEQSLLKSFSRNGKLILYQYQIEKGSMLYIEEAIDAIWRAAKVSL